MKKCSSMTAALIPNSTCIQLGFNVPFKTKNKPLNEATAPLDWKTATERHRNGDNGIERQTEGWPKRSACPLWAVIRFVFSPPPVPALCLRLSPDLLLLCCVIWLFSLLSSQFHGSVSVLSRCGGLKVSRDGPPCLMFDLYLESMFPVPVPEHS